MKTKIFCIVIILLVSCDKGNNSNKSIVVKNKQLVTKKVIQEKVNKKSYKTNALEKTNEADKNRVDELVEIFDENINLSLMSEDELKEYVKNAVENWDNKKLGYLMNKLRANKQYELVVFVASNRVENSETEIERAGKLRSYASALFDNAQSENDYKSAFQVLDNIIETIERKGVTDEESFGVIHGVYHLYSTSKISYENDVTTPINCVRDFEEILDRDNYKPEKIALYTKDLYSNIAETILGVDNNKIWKVSQQDLEQLKNHKNSLPDDEIWFPYQFFKEKGLKVQTLKETMAKVLKKLEKEAKPIKK